ncbi:MAG TPA: nucleotidyltransferase [Clostridiaceae bacterium]|nr:nucleotidyltransferase [Clostridiaceae bacterium]
MSYLGIIAEYNPLHNGHLYHFNTSLDITQAKYSICIMSGNFVQRGEPAVIDKWSRTLAALKAGFDLVLELPVIYCTQSAEIFAYGAVSILNSLNIVDYLSFGSECEDIDILKKIAYVFANEPEEYRDILRQEMDAGNSFASSRANAFMKYIKGDFSYGDADNIKSILQSSNNILALEYLKWLIRLKSPIIPVSVKRIGPDYNDQNIQDGNFASALFLRETAKNHDWEILSHYMPPFSMDILRQCINSGKAPVTVDNFTSAILCKLRQMPLHEISSIIDVSEGLEYRIKKAASQSGSISELIHNIKSKRYTETRIKRILLHSLLGMTKSSLTPPEYIRVLGFSEKGRQVIHKIKESCVLPVITNMSDYKEYKDERFKKMVAMDILATDIYVTAYSKEQDRTGGCDFLKGPVMV